LLFKGYFRGWLMLNGRIRNSWRVRWSQSIWAHNFWGEWESARESEIARAWLRERERERERESEREIAREQERARWQKKARWWEQDRERESEREWDCEMRENERDTARVLSEGKKVSYRNNLTMVDLIMSIITWTNEWINECEFNDFFWNHLGRSSKVKLSQSCSKLDKVGFEPLIFQLAGWVCWRLNQ